MVFPTSKDKHLFMYLHTCLLFVHTMGCQPRGQGAPSDLLLIPQDLAWSLAFVGCSRRFLNEGTSLY